MSVLPCFDISSRPRSTSYKVIPPLTPPNHRSPAPLFHIRTTNLQATLRPPRHQLYTSDPRTLTTFGNSNMPPKNKGKAKDSGDSAGKSGGGKLKPATSINVRHILCEKHSNKEKALEQLREGKKFDEVARELSEDKARQGTSFNIFHSARATTHAERVTGGSLARAVDLHHSITVSWKEMALRDKMIRRADECCRRFTRLESPRQLDAGF